LSAEAEGREAEPGHTTGNVNRRKAVIPKTVVTKGDQATTVPMRANRARKKNAACHVRLACEHRNVTGIDDLIENSAVAELKSFIDFRDH
jgi:hypothetical protein